MNWLFSLYVAVLFFILTPAVLLRIPKKGSKYMVAGVHAIVFALLLHFTGKFVWNVSMSMEGFSEGATGQAAIALNCKAPQVEIQDPTNPKTKICGTKQQAADQQEITQAKRAGAENKPLNCKAPQVEIQDPTNPKTKICGTAQQAKAQLEAARETRANAKGTPKK
jgi:hypothetical protein